MALLPVGGPSHIISVEKMPKDLPTGQTDGNSSLGQVDPPPKKTTPETGQHKPHTGIYQMNTDLTYFGGVLEASSGTVCPLEMPQAAACQFPIPYLADKTGDSCSTFHPSQKPPSKESTKGLTQWLDQSPRDLILFSTLAQQAVKNQLPQMSSNFVTVRSSNRCTRLSAGMNQERRTVFTG